MRRKPRIAVIGAASATFGPKVLKDILNHPQLAGSTIHLMDIDAERLEIMTQLARRLTDSVTLESSTDRRAALEGANYVLISVEIERYKLWKQDFFIPVRLGSRQVTGELGGPGGLFHSLRQIPVHLDIARDIETLCPEAIVMIESNPLNRICLAMRRHTKIGQIIGLCHGVEITQWRLGQILEMQAEEMTATAAGVNHFTWILDLRLAATGEDLYPKVRETLRDADPAFQPLSRKLFDVYGFYPACGDGHIGEYIPYAHEFLGLEGPGLDEMDRDFDLSWKRLRKLARGEKIAEGEFVEETSQEEMKFADFHGPRRWVDTLAFPIMAAIESNRVHRMPAVNMLNEGSIGNLPSDVFVETPAMVDSSGVHPARIGNLPKPLAAFCRRDIDQAELTVEAAVTGDRKLVLQAMLLDPVVDSVRTAEKILDEMMKTQAEYLPQFA
jgi:alpha-galactosidase